MVCLQSMRFCIALAWTLHQFSIAARLKASVQLGTNEGDSVHLGIQAGRLLNDRYLLEHLMEEREKPPVLLGMHPGFPVWGQPMQPRVIRTVVRQPTVQTIPGPQLLHGHVMHAPPKVPSEKPGETFPQGTNFSSQSPTHLGAGQFGDVWEATDTATGEKVAVKVFYQHTPSGKQYLTWNTADQANREEMKKNIKECELVRDIIRQGKSAYPVGASRICECKGEHIKQGMVNKDNVMYTVWEMCGKSLTKLRTELGSFTAYDRQRAARLMTKQVLEGIYLFSMFNPKLIHHDMKADNAVVLGSLEGGYEVKLIDFGCFVRASPENKHSQSIGDPDYMPPEHTMYKAFEDPPSSFDSYGVGLLHMELLCPALKTTDWSPAQAMRANPHAMMAGKKYVLSFTNVKKAMMERCPELFASGFNGSAILDDLDLIEKLTYITPSRRLLPEVALEHKAMDALEDTKTKLEFSPGDKVEYYSVSRGGIWIPCQVQSLNTEFGYYNLLEEVPGGLKPLHSLADPAKVRAQVVSDALSVDESFQVPLVAMTFNVGDKVEYYQSTNNLWIGCTISKVSQPQDGVGTGTYDLILEDGTPYRTGVLPERVREPPFPPGTRVIVYTDIPGIVESYDKTTETYRVKDAKKSDTTYPSVSREFIALDA